MATKKGVSRALYLRAIAKIEVLSREIDRLKKKNDQEKILLEALNRVDDLTGLGNRRAFDETIAREISRAVRDKTPLVLVVFDLDRFKPINDTYGHKGGDEMLKSLARIIRAAIRENDFAARYGGDEFVLVLSNTNLHQATVLVARLQEMAKELRAYWNGKTFTTTISIGVAEMVVGESASYFFDRADKILYLAKNAGRNCVRYAQVPKKKKSLTPRQGDRRTRHS